MDTEHIIIGGGPAGLAVAARMRDAGMSFEILEGSGDIGHAWRNHYDRLHLHTVKKYSNLPLKPFPEEYGTYVSRQQLVDYMEAYARDFNIKPRFNSHVHQIRREQGRWVLSINDDDTLYAQNVIVATGVNRYPRCPAWPGQEDFEGTIIHSRFYRNTKPFAGKRVLVIGMGNTGAELALDLAEHQIDVTIAVRSPISVVPRDLNGRPVQVTSKQLAKLPFGLGDWLGNQIRKVYFGNIEKYGLPVSSMPPAVQLRLTGKTPVIDIGTIDAIKKGLIRVKPGVASLSPKQVAFDDGTSRTFEAIILATGYEAGLEDMISGIGEILDKNGLPTSPIGSGKWRGLYFIGYDNYKLGGILGTIYTDSAIIVENLKKHKNLQ